MRVTACFLAAMGVAAGGGASAQTTAASKPPTPRKLLIWELGVSLSGGVVYRMETMPPSLQKMGVQLVDDARRKARQVGPTLPAHEVLEGPQVDLMKALGYLEDPSQHPISLYLGRTDGPASAALFQLGLLSQLGMMSIIPGSEPAKDLAARLEAAATAAELPRASWGGLVDALRQSGAKNVRDKIADMLDAVGALLVR